MKNTIFSRLMLFFCGALLIVAAPGCTSPDRWAVFEDAVKPPLSNDPADPVIQPVQLRTEGKIQPDTSESSVPDNLSIEEAVMLALRHNSDLRVRQLSPVIAGTFEQIERGVYDPELFAEAVHSREEDGAGDSRADSQRDDSTEETSLSAGLRQTLPSGTSVQARVGQERSVFDNDDEEEQEARVEMSITQSLLRGFGASVNLVSIRQAELETLASVDELKGFILALLADTEIAYWQYVLALEEIAIFEQSLEVARKQREEIELSIEVGLLPEFEVAAARAEEALRVQALINAESLVEDRRLRLLRLISPRPGNNLNHTLKATSEPRVLPEPITDLEDRLRLAEQARPDLNEARLRLRQNRLETIVTRNGLLPRLDLFITLGKTGYGETFGDSFRELNGDAYDVSAGLRLSHFLGNRAAEARNIAAFAARKQAEEAIANLLEIVRLDVHLAVNEVERLRRQIDASRATRVFQEQTLKAEKERFDVGNSTALLVAQAQRDLLQAQINEIGAVVSYRIALVQLYLADGSIMERRGVQVTGAGSNFGY
jgi:outer membrane protein TolC